MPRKRRGADGAPHLTVTVADSSGRLRLTRHFELFAGHAFVRTWGVVERADDDGDPPVIDGAAILHLAVARGNPTTLFHVEQFSWPYHKDFFSQRQIPLVPNLTPHEIRMGSFPAHYTAPTSCAWVALRDGPPDRPGARPGGGPGLVVGIEFNGKSRLRAWATPETRGNREPYRRPCPSAAAGRAI